MHSRRKVFFVLPTFLAGCSGLPQSYPPPPQRNPRAFVDVIELGSFVNMNDPDAEGYFVRDVGPHLNAGSWRWAGRRPELKFQLSSVKDLRFEMAYTIPEITLEKTGPLTLSIFVNDRLLDRMLCPKHGQFAYRKAVPSAWLRSDAATIVAIESDKTWTTDAKAVLSIILTSAGFRP